MWVTRTALALSLLALGANAPAASKAELEARIQQLERKLDSRGLVELSGQISALQREVQQLRGDIEVQTHSMEGLQKRQRDLSLDIDRRLHRLEVGGGAQGQPATGSTPAPGSVSTGGVSTSVPATPASAAAPALKPADQRKDYDHALDQLKEGRYSEASAAFKDFLKKYPGSSYADNAQYWLGEAYYVTRQFEQALMEYTNLLNHYPDSKKLTHSLLKIGFCYYEMGQTDEALARLEKLRQEYPGTTAARLADERLKKMAQDAAQEVSTIN